MGSSYDELLEVIDLASAEGISDEVALVILGRMTYAAERGEISAVQYQVLAERLGDVPTRYHDAIEMAVTGLGRSSAKAA